MCAAGGLCRWSRHEAWGSLLKKKKKRNLEDGVRMCCNCFAAGEAQRLTKYLLENCVSGAYPVILKVLSLGILQRTNDILEFLNLTEALNVGLVAMQVQLRWRSTTLESPSSPESAEVAVPTPDFRSRFVEWQRLVKACLPLSSYQ